VISDGTVAEPIEDELKNQNYSDLPDFSSNAFNFSRYPYHVKGIKTFLLRHNQQNRIAE